jgi:hypothetical protein
MTFIYVPREEIANGNNSVSEWRRAGDEGSNGYQKKKKIRERYQPSSELISTMLTLVWTISGIWSDGEKDLAYRKGKSGVVWEPKETVTYGIAYVWLHVADE